MRLDIAVSVLLKVLSLMPAAYTPFLSLVLFVDALAVAALPSLTGQTSWVYL